MQSASIEDFNSLDEARKILIRTSDLMVIRNPYVMLGLVILGVMILIGINKMPQAKDVDGTFKLRNAFSNLLGRKKYTLGVLSQVFYVGAQIMCWTYIYQYAEAIGMKGETAANYQFLAFILFLVGRSNWHLVTTVYLFRTIANVFCSFSSNVCFGYDFY